MTEFAQLPLQTFEYEAQLQSWLASHPDAIESGLWIVGYEFPLGENRADLLAVDGDGRLVVIEVKRANATREAVGQVLDYVSALEEVDPTEIASTINTAEARPEFAPVDDFERQFAERYAAAAASGPDLMPVRAILAATSESPETDRILEYLQGIGMDIDSVVFNGALAEDGKRTYQRKRAARPVDDDGAEAAPDTVEELGMREPCQASRPEDGKKGRLEIEEIHRRSEEYPGVDLFRSVHCAIVCALPQAREIALPARNKARELTVAIAFDMAPTPEDGTNSRLEYLRIRMYPDHHPGEVFLVLFDRALRRAGDAITLLDELKANHPDYGYNVRGEPYDRASITAETWPEDRPAVARLLNAIHEGWQAEREAGAR